MTGTESRQEVIGRAALILTKSMRLLAKRTFKHVVSAGNPSPTPPQEDQEQQSEKRDEEKGDGDDEAIKAKGKAAKQTRRERKLKRYPKPSLDDSFNEEEETKRAKKFEKTMENLENKRAKMVDKMQSIVT